MGFSADWLALREPADRAARDPALAQAAATAAGPAPVILDLGCGTGSTRRALGPHLAQGAQWRMVDNDPALLALAAAPGVTTVAADLTRLDHLPWDGVTLVTCSALLDLVSGDWIARLTAILAERRLPFYAALNYDGHMAWDPVDPDDAAVTAAFNRHQTGDKGFGPSLGPQAAGDAAARLEAVGFVVATADSPWRMGPQDAPLQAALLDGIGAAAAEAGAGVAPAWIARRRAALSRTAMVVGHLDLFARPLG
ncbi:MAG: class I SAM-dependent methyltransferase [Rhodobacteraceae bacterium]|nr:class I SAM-dependent methyltransferase [Paracoccaceae bacterium]